MKFKIPPIFVFVLVVVAGLSLKAGAQTITLTNGVQKYASLASTTVNMSGRCELWVTSASAPLSGCTINLNSVDAWLFLPGIKPSVATSTYLSQVRVSGVAAAAGSNVRVVQYGQYGTIVIPQSASFQPLTVFSEPEFGGTATQYSQWTYYTGSGIARFSSFKLKRGYQAVFAQSADGKNWSKCYVAQDGDLEIGTLPANLDKQVLFIYVTPWRWTSKKGIAGNPGNSWLNLDWWYDWNIDQTSSSDLEYVAIRQHQTSPSLGQNWQSLGINTVLGYNEPDQANQANLTIAQAISSWGDLLGTGLRVGSPATSDGAPNSWLIPFVSQADAAGLRVDFVVTHYYQGHNPGDPAGCASQMYNFLLNIWNNTHRPLWVTEWNNGANWTDNNPWPAPTYAQQQACVAAMQQMLETNPFVERYALYNWVEDTRSLVTSSNTVTAAGTGYSNFVSALSYVQALPDNGTRGIAQYLFATNTFDTSGYCNNGMAVESPAYSAGHNSQASAIVLDGANNYVQLPANIAKGSAFTFAAWVYWNGGSSWQRIFDFGNDTSHYLFLTPGSGSGTLRFAINNGSGEQVLERSGTLASGSWQHVAFTLSNTTAILYVNGAQVASSSSFSILPSAFSPIKNYLGKSQFPGDPIFNGKMDEVEIADYAMSAAQISALYSTVQSPVATYFSGVWTNDANGTWSITNNWDGGLVAGGGNGVNYSADFSTINITADRTVTLDSPRNIGTLRFGDISGSQNWILAGTSPLTLAADATNAPGIVVNQNTATILTPLTGSYGFAKSGAGTLVLSNATSPSGTVYLDSGSTTSSDGSVRANSPGALANVSAIQIRDAGSGSSTLQLDGSAGSIDVPGVSLNGRNSAVPAIENLAGVNTLGGGISVYGGGTYAVQADAGTLIVGGSITTSDGGSDAVTFQGNGLVSLIGSVTDGTGKMSVNKAGAGTLAIGAGSTYSGLTTVSQGTLALQSPATPMLHFTFDNAPGSGNGTVITNSGSSGAAMNGTIVGGGASIVSGGRYGNALSINGAGGTSETNIVLINSKVFNTDATGNWTVGYWIKTGTAGAVIMYQGDGTWSSAGQTTYLLNADTASPAGTAAGAVRWAGGFLTGTAALTDNHWHFVTLVDNAGTESIYVDGNVDALTSSMGLPLASDANQIWIGGAPDTDAGAVKMNGLIDEVYLFNRALSQAEVQSLYSNNSITNAPVNALPLTTPVSVYPAGILDLAGVSQTLAGLYGGGLVTNSGNAVTLNISNAASAGTFFGNLSDASPGNVVNFSKSGSGTFALAGTNTYHGATTVNGGTLKLSPVADDSVLHLTFNNSPGSGNGTTITNIGSGGTSMNGTIVSSGGAYILSGGRFGNTLYVNGTGGNASNNIVVITNKVLSTDSSASWTVGCWIKTATAGAAILYQGDGTWSSSGQTSFYLNSGSSTPGSKAGAVRYGGGWLTGTAALNNNAWHFVTLVDNAGTESIYVDGNVDAVTSTMGGALVSDANQIWIGGSPDPGDGAAKMTGFIDEVYMFNRALSQTEVQSLYSYNSVFTNAGNVLPPATAVSVVSGGTFDLGGVSQTIGSLTGNGMVTNTGNAATLTVSNNAGTTTFSGSMGDHSAGSALSLVQNGGGTTILSGANTFRGGTLVNAGTLLVTGSTGTGAMTVANGGTFGGNGVVGGPVTVQAGGTLMPGGGMMMLKVNNNVNLQAGGTTVLEISKTLQTNDQLWASGTLTYGGTLIVTNLSGAFVGGESYPLFQAGAFSGSFNAFSLPALATGLAWNTNSLSSGVLTVVQTAPTNVVWSVNGSNLSLSWPAGYVGWRLQVQTNDLNTGLGTNWVDVPGSSLTNTMVFPVDGSQGSIFYRLVF